MRLKPLNSSFLLIPCFALLSAISVIAQEDRSSEIETIVRETHRNDVDPGGGESESKKTTSPTVKEATRDTISQVRPLKPVKPMEKVPKEEDPLSFNFLYYIIEKFKLSDIIE